GTGPYTIVYKENGGADRTASGVVSATSFAPFTATVTSSTTYTLVSVTGSDSCSRTTGFTGGSATITVNSTPSIPIQGTITQPNCVTPTGSISLSGLVASGTWTITQGGTSTNSYSSSGTSYLISNLAPGTYTFSIGNALGCTSSATASIVINSPVTNTWNGSVWSTGSPPVATEAALFTGNYQTTGNLSACSCTVNAGATVIVNSGHTLTIANFVNNNGGTLTFENNSSLLQTSDAVNTGNIIYKRITPGIRRFDLTYWSSPVVRTPAFTLKDLSPNTLRDKYYYWNTTTGWTVILDGTQEMGKGIGYSIRAPQPYDTTIPATYTAVFTGVPNNGPVSVSVGPADKWNLIGNPYPSAIYADQFIVDNQANIYGTLYFWTHNSLPSAAPGSNLATYNNDDFAIYNLTGNATVGGLVGTGASTPGNQNPPLGYIAAGQAFFAKSKTGLNAVFTNSMRVVGSNTQFYKTSNADKADVTIEKHRVWLNLTNTQGAFKQILIGYVTGATNLWDNNYDGLTIDANKYVDFYSINEDRKLVIQGRALPFSDLDTVPLGYRSELAGVFSIAIDHADGDLSTHSIYLEDKVTGLMQDLQISNYTFTTAIGTFTDRFVLRYKNSAVLGTDDLENEKNRVIVSVKNKIIKLSSNSNTENLNEVVIFDVSGKVLYDKKQIGSNQLEISNLKSGEQVLIVKTILDNGYTTTNKIIF
ncbi:T9SS sorting signal type C domain-containing protein, partial [Flavobacterium sp. MC2016-06]|uniref:T9SS sorting signal type C domain-containing protein n=1 Tax=Flavobacterium sp. MC2016-06 TaxID=2676308 RepID=UPI0031D50A68